VINDGVTIARAITLPDPVENAGAQLIKEVVNPSTLNTKRQIRNQSTTHPKRPPPKTHTLNPKP